MIQKVSSRNGPTYHCTQRNNIRSNKLNKGMKDLQNTAEEIKDLTLSKWKDTPSSGIRTHNVFGVSATYSRNLQIQGNPRQNPTSPFPRNRGRFLNPYGIARHPERLKQYFKKNKAGGLTPPGFKTHHKAVVPDTARL